MGLSRGDLCCGYRRLFKEDGPILKIKVKTSFVLFSIFIIFSIRLLIGTQKSPAFKPGMNARRLGPSFMRD